MTTSNTTNSQASSFMSSLKGGVDPRTGQYNFSINLPKLQCNELNGPNVAVDLTFSSLNTRDSGYGLGWNFNLSQFTPGIDILALSTGETFKVTGSGQTPDIKEKKLDSFKFENNQDGTYRVLHKSGLIETLKVGGSEEERVALPCMIQSPSGHSVTLEYADFKRGQRLESIRDGQGKLLLQIKQPHDYLVELLLYPEDGPQGGPVARYQFKLNDSGWVIEIVLPTDENASWRLGYGDGLINGFLCLQDIKTPVGGHETIEYRDEGHPFPAHMQRPNLPRVTRHRTYPGFGQPKMEMIYSYDHLNNSSNFLGYGTATPVEEGLDTLYEAPAEYVYGTRAMLMDGGAAVRQVDRTFNRFHLLTKEITTQDHCIQEVLTTYYADDRSFEFQDPRFQLVKNVQTAWKRDDTNDYHAENASSEYDVYGNPVEEVQDNGIKTVYTYYPRQHPDGFVRELKDTTVYPSPRGQGDAPILRTRLTYTELPALSGSDLGGWLVVESETSLQVQLVTANGQTTEVETELQHLQREYFNTPDDASLHGRPDKISTTLNANTSTLNYEYSTRYSELAGEAVLQVDETFCGFDGAIKSTTQQASLLTGEPVVTSDANNVKTVIHHDAMGRVASQTIAPHSDAQASAVHAYFLSASDGGQASEHFTDFKNVRTVTRYDGMARMIYQGIHDPDQAPRAEPRQTYEAKYNALGELFEVTTFDWFGTTKLSLTSQYERDSWGKIRSVRGPEGVSIINETTPFGTDGPRECSWVQSAAQPPEISNLTVSQYNRFGKLDYVRRLDATALNARLKLQSVRSVSELVELLLLNEELPTVNRVEYSYDGLGSCIQQVELLDDNVKRTTQYAYDVWGRMHTTKLPDKTSVSRTFAQHSAQEHPTALRVTPGNTAKPEVIAGEQIYDGLLRLTARTVGARLEEFRYAEGQMQVSQRITPGKRTFEYKYDLSRTAQPCTIQEMNSGEITTYDYDPLSASIVGALNANGNRKYEYNAVGHLSKESWTDTGGTPRETSYVTSLQGRHISRSHTDGLETLYAYDDKGRVESVTQGELQADFEYNLLAQPWRTTTRNLRTNSTLITEVEFDSLAREIKRTLIPSGQSTRTITQIWLSDDQLESRHLEMDGRTVLKEEFVYDLRNRLQEHHCSGEILPKDTYGNEITAQIFRFDDLDNIERCMTTFKNGKSDDARFTYSLDDKCQLKKVTHSWLDGGYPQECTFDYDDDGHMLNDEQRQRLNYDSYGRLIKVQDPSEEQTLSTYRYDGHDHLVGVCEGDQAETLRFYLGNQLSHTIQDDKHTQYLYHGDRPLGQQQLNDHEQTMLLLTDASPSVIGESLQAGLRTAVYNAYGGRSSEEELQTLLGFNSEVREQNGWSLLGRGYRAYNPCLMRFHSPDSDSPFDGGGVNPYVYCLGNPIAFRDPTGHRATNGRPPDDSGTIDIPDDLLEKIGFAVGLAAGAAVAIIFAAPTGGATISWVAVAAAVAATIFAGIGMVGVFTDNRILTFVGITGSTLTSVAAVFASRYTNRQDKKLGRGKYANQPSSRRGSATAEGPSTSDRLDLGETWGIPRVNTDNQAPFSRRTPQVASTVAPTASAAVSSIPVPPAAPPPPPVANLNSEFRRSSYSDRTGTVTETVNRPRAGSVDSPPTRNVNMDSFAKFEGKKDWNGTVKSKNGQDYRNTTFG